jgi:hypothetical protein
MVFGRVIEIVSTVDFLQFPCEHHNSTYQLIGGNGVVRPIARRQTDSG